MSTSACNGLAGTNLLIRGHQSGMSVIKGKGCRLLHKKDFSALSLEVHKSRHALVELNSFYVTQEGVGQRFNEKA